MIVRPISNGFIEEQWDNEWAHSIININGQDIEWIYIVMMLF